VITFSFFGKNSKYLQFSKIKNIVFMNDDDDDEMNRGKSSYKWWVNIDLYKTQ